MKKQEWFKDWFDTKYYHILYQDRNDDEAQVFMRHLVSFLKLKKNSKILDLPCGRGRHSVFLNHLGYDVIGADLSENSIAFAKQFENKTLHFEVHDMREPFQTKFDAIFNLFTSFGYFDDEHTNIQVLENLKNGLKENGVLVIDFMNVNQVKKSIVYNETINKNDIDFHISRTVDGNAIIKDIRFFADGKEHFYKENIKFLPLDTLKIYFKAVGLELKHIFGSYLLEGFDIENSSRLILILE
ncbi:class I SAM-dependent methyltransferase [Aureibaculum sp. 2210JD6-5]|uniref:SAM-dependent methyltransferase n=1 Tax=Aureibaculum sp. 2210JD6-5 TaxID=3103957 RepID=UPI002AAEBAC0|nr:class I SAM-dependent methyltransferase [Aureibaculum sp. 2210JD6-5]MDY7394274.1 class I SAM-dependent methyltransferase [Aureibaculum sp. 2210JD6-5]